LSAGSRDLPPVRRDASPLSEADRSEQEGHRPAVLGILRGGAEHHAVALGPDAGQQGIEAVHDLIPIAGAAHRPPPSVSSTSPRSGASAGAAGAAGARQYVHAQSAPCRETPLARTQAAGLPRGRFATDLRVTARGERPVATTAPPSCTATPRSARVIRNASRP